MRSADLPVPAKTWRDRFPERTPARERDKNYIRQEMRTAHTQLQIQRRVKQIGGPDNQSRVWKGLEVIGDPTHS